NPPSRGVAGQAAAGSRPGSKPSGLACFRNGSDEHAGRSCRCAGWRRDVRPAGGHEPGAAMDGIPTSTAASISGALSAQNVTQQQQSARLERLRRLRERNAATEAEDESSDAPVDRTEETSAILELRPYEHPVAPPPPPSRRESRAHSDQKPAEPTLDVQA